MFATDGEVGKKEWVDSLLKHAHRVPGRSLTVELIPRQDDKVGFLKVESLREEDSGVRIADARALVRVSTFTTREGSKRVSQIRFGTTPCSDATPQRRQKLVETAGKRWTKKVTLTRLQPSNGDLRPVRESDVRVSEGSLRTERQG
jgi:hypothetical protein